MLRFFVTIIALCALGMSSCKQKTVDIFTDVKGSYFSIDRYIIDEWRNHAGEPVVFQKTVIENGKKDSSYVNVEKVDWPVVLKFFTETEISDRKFLGKYNFDQFDDNFENTHNFLYTAKTKDLYTQKLLITMDVNSMMVRAIYIETLKSSFWNERIQKLTYTPLRTIMIQQYDRPLLGSKKESVTKYKTVQ